MNLREAGKALAVDGEMAAEPQRFRLAGGAAVGIVDVLEFSDMREAENAPMHLDAGEAERVLPDAMEKVGQRLLGGEAVILVLVERGGIEDAASLGPPQARELGLRSVVQIVVVTPSIQSR